MYDHHRKEELLLQIVDGEVYFVGEMEGFMEFHRMAKVCQELYFCWLQIKHCCECHKAHHVISADRNFKDESLTVMAESATARLEFPTISEPCNCFAAFHSRNCHEAQAARC